MKEEILEAKKKLYLLLLQSNSNLLTKNEIDIMFLISKDKQYQNLLKKQKQIIDSEINQVLSVYESLHNGYTLSEKFKISIKNFILKLNVNEVVYAMEISCSRFTDREYITKYFCGICWNKIKEL